VPTANHPSSTVPDTVSNAAGRDRFAARLAAHGLRLDRLAPRVLQINVGRLCNLTCVHCHVNAGPNRTEVMAEDTLERTLRWLETTPIPVVDLTGGAPEMMPGFREAIRRLRAMTPARHIIDRCNLTILLEPGFDDLPAFLAAHRVEIVASLPCYEPENVNAQRGDGVFDASIEALRRLNALGYGTDPDLPLHLVYNPAGARLPPDQASLETDYKAALRDHFGIAFNRLFTLTNMPIARFASWLRRAGQLAAYRQLLEDHFNPAAVSALMCRDTISVDWRGRVYDCDFNQQLGLHATDTSIWELDLEVWASTAIRTADHCFGCTAGCGSSCGGALT